MTDLVPTIVQDAATGTVLMLAHSNETSIEATERTGFVHFWSRSRGRLWKKGETSGNTLRLVDLHWDCDRDALLVLATPAGPVCHTGAATCFQAPPLPAAAIGSLWRTITDRAAERPEGSYTASLLEAGTDACARKVIEEAVETAFAAKDAAATSAAGRVAEEAADLVYHLLVLLTERGIGLDDVAAVLSGRAG